MNEMSALPKYRMLAICIKAALYGAQHPMVQHMIQRNRDIAELEALPA